MFRHPKYYKELRKRNKSDQVISEEATDVFDTSVHLVRANSNKLQAPSSKQQASSTKLLKEQAASIKRQA